MHLLVHIYMYLFIMNDLLHITLQLLLLPNFDICSMSRRDSIIIFPRAHTKYTLVCVCVYMCVCVCVCAHQYSFFLIYCVSCWMSEFDYSWHNLAKIFLIHNNVVIVVVAMDDIHCQEYIIVNSYCAFMLSPYHFFHFLSLPLSSCLCLECLC